MERRGADVSTSERDGPEQLCHVVSVSPAQPKRTGRRSGINNLKSSSGACRRCLKSQLIDLAEEGYGPSLMDAFQPDIRVSDW